jgi:hypothetical protein
MRQSLVDVGICHFMTVFRTPEGRLVQFDFGPQGGDVEKLTGPFAAVLRAARRQQRQLELDAAGGGGGGGGSSVGGLRLSPSAPTLEFIAEGDVNGSSGGSVSSQQQRQERANGEIRERELAALPTSHMYVGRTALTLDDVRMYNGGRARRYRLHDNDCRCGDSSHARARARACMDGSGGWSAGLLCC